MDEEKPTKHPSEVFDEILDAIKALRIENGLAENQHGGLTLITDNGYIANFFDDLKFSENMMMESKCPEFEHGYENPLSEPDEGQKVVELGNVKVLCGVKLLDS